MVVYGVTSIKINVCLPCKSDNRVNSHEGGVAEVLGPEEETHAFPCASLHLRQTTGVGPTFYILVQYHLNLSKYHNTDNSFPDASVLHFVEWCALHEGGREGGGRSQGYRSGTRRYTHLQRCPDARPSPPTH